MATQTKTSGAKPTHRIYLVIGEGKKASWRELGAAWPNRDGKGFSLTCDAIPLQGHIVMREITEKPEAQTDEAA